MVKRMVLLFSALLLLTWSAGLANAETQKPRLKPTVRTKPVKPVKVFQGTFINPAGKPHRIEVIDGGHLNIKNTQENLFYRLSARTIENGQVEVTIQQFLDADYTVVLNEERLETSLDGQTKRTSLAPFRFTLDGEKKRTAEIRTGVPKREAVGGACCIDCGDGWVTCCGVAIYEEGWIACCSIDTWCAWCDVCAWWLE